jgi:hypothetical protein
MKHLTTNVTHINQIEEASAPQQQGFEAIGEILKRIAIKKGGGS